METAIVTFGGILLLFSLGGGILAKCNCFRADDRSHKVDRIGAGLVGIGLIAMAIVITVGAPAVSLIPTFGATLVVVLLYSLYLALSRQ